MEFLPAEDVKIRIAFLVKNLHLDKVILSRLYFFRSVGSTGRATARIWSLPTIWQKALGLTPGYCLEVISERFDRLSPRDQEHVLIHELLHIPKNFTGGLVPHRNSKRRTFRHYHHDVEVLFNSLEVKSYEQ